MLTAKKELNGSYNMVGETVLVPKELQLRTFRQLILALKSRQTICGYSTPQVLNKGCFSDSNHSLNIINPDYKREIKVDGCSKCSCRSNLKDLTV